MVDANSQFLYVLKAVRPGMVTEGPTPDEAQVLDEHVGHLNVLAKEGTAIVFGRTQNADETTFGLVIFEAESAESAGRIMRLDPAIQKGLMSATLFPFMVAGARV